MENAALKSILPFAGLPEAEISIRICRPRSKSRRLGSRHHRLGSYCYPFLPMLNADEKRLTVGVLGKAGDLAFLGTDKECLISTVTGRPLML